MGTFGDSKKYQLIQAYKKGLKNLIVDASKIVPCLLDLISVINPITVDDVSYVWGSAYIHPLHHDRANGPDKEKCLIVLVRNLILDWHVRVKNDNYDEFSDKLVLAGKIISGYPEASVEGDIKAGYYLTIVKKGVMP